jgi:hypothetical protein
MPKGWECPKCGRVYAPFVSECQTCNVKNQQQGMPQSNYELPNALRYYIGSSSIAITPLITKSSKNVNSEGDK